ncbi:MAG: CBS domain-containing protein [Nannocystaceae bacterium]
MKRSTKISTIMCATPVTVHTEQKVSDVRRAFETHKIHHVPVVSGTRFIGLISASDLLRVSFGDTYTQDTRAIDSLLDTMSITEVMIEDVYTIDPSATIREAAEKLATGSFHGLPVVDAEGNLKGMLTSTDLIKFLLDQF